MTREVTESVTREVTESVTREVTEKVTREVKEKVAKEIKEKVAKEVKEQDIKIMVEMFQEYHDTKENAVMKLCSKFPEYAQQAKELVEKYWEEC